VTVRLRLDPIGCHGHGLCAEIVPELLTLDDWGYPVVTQEDVPPELVAAARHAASMCPRIALALEPTPVEAPTRR
jgi:ferredoxin